MCAVFLFVAWCFCCVCVRVGVVCATLWCVWLLRVFIAAFCQKRSLLELTKREREARERSRRILLRRSRRVYIQLARRGRRDFRCFRWLFPHTQREKRWYEWLIQYSVIDLRPTGGWRRRRRRRRRGASAGSSTSSALAAVSRDPQDERQKYWRE